MQTELNRCSLYHSWQKVPCCRAFNQLNAGVLFTVEGEIQFANQQICLYLEQRAGLIYNQTFEDLFRHNPDLLKCFKRAEIYLNKWDCCYLMNQKALFPKTPHHRLFKIMAFWIHPQNKKAGICWVFHDITNLIEKDELKHYEDTSLRLFELLRKSNKHQIDETYVFHQLMQEIVHQYQLKTALYFKKKKNVLLNTYMVQEDYSFPYMFQSVPLDNEIDESIAYQAFSQKKPVGCSDITAYPFYQKYLKSSADFNLPIATYAFPVLINKKTEGVVSFYSYDRFFFSEPVVRQINRLINEICLYIQSNRIEKNHQKSVQDLQKRLKQQVNTLEKNKRTMQKQIVDMNKLMADLVLARNQAETATQSKMNFLANVSHELRTPLNAILGFSQMINAQTYGPIAQPQYRDYVAFIQKSATHLLALINDILDLSRSESGKMNLSETIFSLKKVLTESLDLIQQYPEASERILTLNMPNDIQMRADERILKQIALNILSNSVKFTQKGGHINISVSSSKEGIKLVFADDGIGIPADKADSLFQPFTQIENVLTRSHQGSGLGLVLVKKMVILHGGTVCLESEEGMGTQLLIHFPAERLVQ